jgi:uncharacterized RDD family membrane protein YckC
VSTVRFRDMWTCLAAWVVLDILMIAFGRELPAWLQFDGRDALRRDVWIAWFIAFMWLCYAITPAERQTPSNNSTSRNP